MTAQQPALITFDDGTTCTLTGWSIDHLDRETQIGGWITASSPEPTWPCARIIRADMPGHSTGYAGLDVQVDITSYGLPSQRRYMTLTWRD
jgi:hypothetical protein